MDRLDAEDLDKIKKQKEDENALKEDGFTVKITVHLGTCGLAAGGNEVFDEVKKEIETSGRDDIKVVISGCAGMRSSEPNVTIGRLNEDSVIYQNVNAEKMRKIFQGHVLGSEIQSDYALARIKQSV